MIMQTPEPGRPNSGRIGGGRGVPPRPTPTIDPDDDPTVDDYVADDTDLVAEKDRSFLSRLYTGTGAFQIVQRRRMWYLITAAILLVCLLSMIFRGFTLGIDFEGGTQVSLPATSSSVTTDAVKDVFTKAIGDEPQLVESAGSGASKTIQVRTESLTLPQTEQVSQALAERFAPDITVADVSSSDVSSTWGGEITKKMIIALIVFLVIVFVYIAVRFDREMSIAAMASLFFDIVVTAGVYSLVGWEVTPATVIGLLTILGFSVYDTVVVFDKVGENTRSVLATTRRTYAEQTNLAVNQTLMRSINTTVISVLPIIALMVIAVWLLGVGTLKDLGLIQLVGVVVGTYSSIFLAAPLLVTLKERRKDIAKHTKRVVDRRARIEAGETVTEPRRVRARSGDASQSPTGKRRRSR